MKLLSSHVGAGLTLKILDVYNTLLQSRRHVRGCGHPLLLVLDHLSRLTDEKRPAVVSSHSLTERHSSLQHLLRAIICPLHKPFLLCTHFLAR